MDLYKALAVVGGTSTAIGGGILISHSSLFKENTNSVTSKKKETFRDKYKEAILSKESELWNSKFTVLKGNGEPTHPTLKNSKGNIKSNESKAKDLHKQGCAEIYDSEWENSLYLKDFQIYCAKTMKDGISKGETWNEQAHTESNPWNAKLTSLHSHGVTLSESLKKIKEQISKGSDLAPNWSESKRKALKDWCDAIQLEIFLGENESQFKNAKLYCVGG
nr:hypothetical protein [Mycoplasma haemocanis]